MSNKDLPLICVNYTLEVHAEVDTSPETIAALKQAMTDALRPLRDRLERGEFNKRIIRSRRQQ